MDSESYSPISTSRVEGELMQRTGTHLEYRRPTWRSGWSSIFEALLHLRRENHSWGWDVETEESENRTFEVDTTWCWKRAIEEQEEEREGKEFANEVSRATIYPPPTHRWVGSVAVGVSSRRWTVELREQRKEDEEIVANVWACPKWGLFNLLGPPRCSLYVYLYLQGLLTEAI